MTTAWLRRAALTVLLVASAGGGVGRAQTTGALHLGAVLPFSGRDAQLGAEIRAGLDIASAAYNKSPRARQRAIALTYADSQSNPATAQIEAQRLISEQNVAAFVAACCDTPTVNAIAAVAGRAGRLVIAPYGVPAARLGGVAAGTVIMLATETDVPGSPWSHGLDTFTSGDGTPGATTFTEGYHVMFPDRRPSKAAAFGYRAFLTAAAGWAVETPAAGKVPEILTASGVPDPLDTRLIVKWDKGVLEVTEPRHTCPAGQKWDPSRHKCV